MLPVRRNNQTSWMPDIFNDFFDNTWMERPKATAPAINVIEHQDKYELELAAPGMTKADFNVHLDEDGDLVINMEKKAETKDDAHKGHYLRREFSYTKFQQTMLLPDDANRDCIGAKVENGVLTVSIPKVKRVEPEKTHKQIEVQ
ncbi:MAG: Hsp20/alpha crystallin family protein [Bacteroidales bacterium]|nr:Hsp20/alpha crystallin family protein [Bacteroidales bacterium]